MNVFEGLGGNLVIKRATVDDLEHEAQTNDLVVVAVGKGDISHLFARNADQSAIGEAKNAIKDVEVALKPGTKFERKFGAYRNWANGARKTPITR